MIVALYAALAAAESPWASLPGDVVSEHQIPAAPDRVLAELSDIASLLSAYPSSCVARIEPGVPTSGVGGRAVATWTPSVMNRRLAFDITKIEPTFVQIEASTNRGFTVRYTVTATSAGSRLEAHAYIQPPPWPFRRIWHEDVAPAWRACDAAFARALAARLPAFVAPDAAPAPVAPAVEAAPAEVPPASETPVGAPPPTAAEPSEPVDMQWPPPTSP